MLPIWWFSGRKRGCGLCPGKYGRREFLDTSFSRHLLVHVLSFFSLLQEYAANDFERSAISSYTNSFLYGSIPAHKEGSRAWIADKGPVVERWATMLFSTSLFSPARSWNTSKTSFSFVNHCTLSDFRSSRFWRSEEILHRKLDFLFP